MGLSDTTWVLEPGVELRRSRVLERRANDEWEEMRRSVEERHRVFESFDEMLAMCIGRVNAYSTNKSGLTRPNQWMVLKKIMTYIFQRG